MKILEQILKKYKPKVVNQKRAPEAPQMSWKFEIDKAGNKKLVADKEHLHDNLQNEGDTIEICLKVLSAALDCENKARSILKQMSGMEILSLSEEWKSSVLPDPPTMRWHADMSPKR